MKKQHLEHLLRASGAITGDNQFFVFGSQSILGKYPDAPDDVLMSMEADLIAKNVAEKTDLLNAIGDGSIFHEQNGYYVDPIDLTTSQLPDGWKGRLINFSTAMTSGVTGLCLDPHDLALSKYYAGREKDYVFNLSLIRHGFIEQEKLVNLLDKMKIDAKKKADMLKKIRADFKQ